MIEYLALAVACAAFLLASLSLCASNTPDCGEDWAE